MRAKRIPWATTTIDGRDVSISLVTWKPSYAFHAWTLMDEDTNDIAVEIYAGLLADPERMLEILLHEFVHVIEFAYEDEFLQPASESCSHYAQLIGAYMPGLLRNLRLL